MDGRATAALPTAAGLTAGDWRACRRRAASSACTRGSVACASEKFAGEIGKVQLPQAERNGRVGLEIADERLLVAQADGLVVAPHQPRPGIAAVPERGRVQLITGGRFADVIWRGCNGGGRGKRGRQQAGEAERRQRRIRFSPAGERRQTVRGLRFCRLIQDAVCRAGNSQQ